MHKEETKHMRRNSGNFQGLDHFVKTPFQVKNYQQPSIVKILRDRSLGSQNKKGKFFAKENSLVFNSKNWEDQVTRP